jgi:endonuclease/exonuclease/phosphatase family metal-dependent hydrolase
MSGIEAAGLVLALFPLVIDVVTKYNGLVKGRDIKILDESLKNNEQMFLNSVEFLLQSTIPPEDLTVLLGDFNGDLWKSEWLADRVTKHLGREAESVFQKIEDIHKTVSKLKQKLPVSVSVLP